MKKFIIKTSLFVIPFIVSHFINIKFSQRNQGDLARLGYLYSNPSPFRETIKKFKAYKTEKTTYISTLDLNKVHHFDILTIGDSFSEQGGIGYQTPIVDSGFSVTHVDRFISNESPIQNLVSMANSDFFDYIKPKYVILQSVERATIIRNEALSFSQKKSMDSIKTLISQEVVKKANKKSENKKEEINFFSDTTIKTPIINLQYLFLTRPYKGIYRYKSISKDLFSNNPQELLFFGDEIKTLSQKNDVQKITKLNDNLNKIQQLLAKKGIKLIVLIAPDKYDLYYPYIKNPNKEKSSFFQHLDKMEKNYMYVPSFTILSEEIKKNKDVYFYDDTHWTPNGGFPIARYIVQMIKKQSPN